MYFGAGHVVARGEDEKAIVTAVHPDWILLTGGLELANELLGSAAAERLLVSE
jgi:hypothetical protein